MSVILALIGVGMSAIGAVLIGTSIYFAAGEPVDTSVRYIGEQGETTATVEKQRALATLTPTSTVKKTTSVEATPTKLPVPTLTPSPAPALTQTISPSDAVKPDDSVTADEQGQTGPEPDVEKSVASSTLSNTNVLSAEVASVAVPGAEFSTPAPTAETEPELPVEDKAEIEYVEPYTSTDQVQPPPSANPVLTCPTESTATFDLISVEGQPMKDHPDFLHGDLNLSLRGYTPITESLKLVFYNGATDPNAPRLHGLFEPNRVPKIGSTYQINEWIWESSKCGGTSRGCRGEPIDVFWPVTLAGLVTTPGESIYVPERGPQIHPGGYIAIVLYAEKRRITLGYTRRDNVGAGYAVHLENICVDSNLLALYEAQTNADGWHTSGFLPALRNNQALGTALRAEIQVAIRDAGSFMDPRSDKDWWR